MYAPGPASGVTSPIEPPVSPPVRESTKSSTSTPVTSSLNFTVQETVEALVGEGPARLIDSTVGAVRSIVQVYRVAGEIPAESTARTWNVCNPSARSVEAVLVAGFVVPQSVNDDPSSEHWNFSTESLSLKVKDGVRFFETSDGEAVIAGAAGALCLANPKPNPA